MGTGMQPATACTPARGSERSLQDACEVVRYAVGTQGRQNNLSSPLWCFDTLRRAFFRMPCPLRLRSCRGVPDSAQPQHTQRARSVHGDEVLRRPRLDLKCIGMKLKGK